MNILYTAPRDIYATPALERVLFCIEEIASKTILVGWDKTKDLKSEKCSEYHFKKNKNYFNIFLWQFYLLHKLFTNKPDIIFNISPLSFLPIFFYKLFFKVKVIYDCRDYFAVSIAYSTLNEKVLKYIDNFFASRCDIIIAPDLYSYKYFEGITDEKIIIIPNTTKYYGVKKEKTNDKIKLAYLGYLSNDRNFNMIFEFIKKNTDIELHIACTYIPENLKKRIPKLDNIFIHNRLTHIEAHNLLSKMDYCLLTYDSKLDNYKYIQPTKFYDCLSIGLPYICTKGMISLEKHVNNLTQNLSVDYNSIKFPKLVKTDFSDYNHNLYNSSYQYDYVLNKFKKELIELINKI